MKFRIATAIVGMIVLGGGNAVRAEDLEPMQSAQETIRQTLADREAPVKAQGREGVADEVYGKGEVSGEGLLYSLGSRHWFSGNVRVSGKIGLSVADYAGSVTLEGEVYVSGNDGASDENGFFVSGEGDVAGVAELSAPGGRSLKFTVTRHVMVTGSVDIASMKASVRNLNVEIREPVMIETRAPEAAAKDASNQGPCFLVDMRDRLCIYRCSDGSRMQLPQVETNLAGIPTSPCRQLIVPF